MNLLLDTNVLSELVRECPHPNVLRFIHEADEDRIFLSAMTWAEIRRGIALLPLGRKRDRLTAWLEDDLRERFGPRLLPISLDIADRWGVLMANAKTMGLAVSVVDGFLAATALAHNLCLVTRNVKDFESLGVELLNPWASADPAAAPA